jgi:hypothetical protein
MACLMGEENGMSDPPKPRSTAARRPAEDALPAPLCRHEELARRENRLRAEKGSSKGDGATTRHS